MCCTRLDSLQVCGGFCTIVLHLNCMLEVCLKTLGFASWFKYPHLAYNSRACQLSRFSISLCMRLKVFGCLQEYVIHFIVCINFCFLVNLKIFQCLRLADLTSNKIAVTYSMACSCYNMAYTVMSPWGGALGL